MGWPSFVLIILHFLNINFAASLKEEFDCSSQNGYIFADPDNCQCFFECTNNVPIHMCCAAGLYFDDTTFICNYDYNVDCGDRPEPGNWEKGLTDVDIDDGFKSYTCQISFEFHVNNDLQNVQFRESKSDCSEAREYKKDTIQLLGKHEFGLSSPKNGVNLACFVGAAMVEGVFLERLLDTLHCDVNGPCDFYSSSTSNETDHYGSTCTQVHNVPDADKRDFAEFYGKSIIRLLRRLRNKPLDWHLVGHNGQYVRTLPCGRLGPHPAFNIINQLPIHPTPGIYMYFMSPTPSERIGQPIKWDTPQNPLLVSKMNEIMNEMNNNNLHWQHNLHLEYNADDLIIPFYIGKTGDTEFAGLRQRYLKHNQQTKDGVVNRWREMMRSTDFIANIRDFDLYYTFVEMRDDLDAEINERLFLEMFNFMDNDKDNIKRRSVRNQIYKPDTCTYQWVYCDDCFLQPKTYPADEVADKVADMEDNVDIYISEYWYGNYINYEIP